MLDHSHAFHYNEFWIHLSVYELKCNPGNSAMKHFPALSHMSTAQYSVWLSVRHCRGLNPIGASCITHLMLSDTIIHAFNKRLKKEKTLMLA